MLIITIDYLSSLRLQPPFAITPKFRNYDQNENHVLPKQNYNVRIFLNYE